MSSNSRITRSKGSSDGMSLPPYTRPRKDTSTKADNAGSLQPSTQQQTACDQLNSTVSHSPFARPGSQSTHMREQDFMAITAEVEVLCQQLKGRGMYTIPSTPSTTNSTKSGRSVHFEPIDPAQKSSVQAMDQSLLNSSLNLLDDLPQTQSSSNDKPTSHGQVTP